VTIDHAAHRLIVYRAITFGHGADCMMICGYSIVFCIVTVWIPVSNWSG